MDKYGDFHVGRTIKADRRVNTGAQKETLNSTRLLIADDYQWLRFTCTSTQNVDLPDATTLPLSWSVVLEVLNSSTAGIQVRTFDDTTPAELKAIIPGRAYQFTCVDNTSDAGEWHINFLEEADLIPTERYVSTFDATTSWGSVSGGYYTITVTAATHGRGIQPNVNVRKLSGSDYTVVMPDSITILANGNVSIKVPSIPDLRFAGQILFI